MTQEQSQICTVIPPGTRRTGPFQFDPHAIPGAGWTVDLIKIQLEDPGDIVVWHLEQIWKVIPGVRQVMLTFRNGSGASVPLGPFTSLAVDLDAMTATGTRPDGVRDCYLYNILVCHSSGQSWNLFPIDPQIDNIPPPAEGGNGSHEGEEGERFRAKAEAREGHGAAGPRAGSRTRKSETSSAPNPGGGRRES